VIAPYGSWRSPVSAELVAGGRISLDSLQAEGDDLYWLEGRPSQGGRCVLVRNGGDVTPAGFNVRTRVHEYGGGAYRVHGGVPYASNFADQRLYRGEMPLTPDNGSRFADARLTPDGQTIVCVRQLNDLNEIVAMPTDGSAPPRVVASGADFYSNPRISPDGQKLAYLSWNHPNMPWDGTDLWVSDLDGANPRHVAGGPGESIFQPEWSPSGELHFVSDRSGWWNLYTEHGPLAPMEAEFGRPQWVFGMSTYAFLSDGRIAAIYTSDGLDHLAILESQESPLPPRRERARVRELRTPDLPYTAFAPQLVAWRDKLAFIAASPTEPASVIAYDPASGQAEVLRRGFEAQLDPACISQPRPITFPTDGGHTAHAIFYAPTNGDYQGPAGKLPPLIVVSHGGPTSQTQARFDPAVAFWTSRGFAVVDVNYGGSTGYGRAYRERLTGQWGIVDTADCINAARCLAQQGEVDGCRLAIRGGSAGGYTTLCALTFHNAFSAGASYYGVAELESLATDTHKFESRYLDGLIGPYPERKDLYHARSPIHFAASLSCPVILFQGLEDKIVPPEQAEIMVEALEAKGLPYAYVTFEGEQHGFRRAETIQRTLEAELYFYSRVFGFDLADAVEPVLIHNL
jgi:dipeptidyl aminopeptidase/acylaminoacyl peptidase